MNSHEQQVVAAVIDELRQCAEWRGVGVSDVLTSRRSMLHCAAELEALLALGRPDGRDRDTLRRKQ